MISDLQLQVRELSVRFAEVEFEKAERNQIRADLKHLERRMDDNLQRMAAQLEQHESSFDRFSVSEPRQENGIHLPELLERLERIEGRIQNLDPISSQISELDKGSGAHAQQLSQMQAQHSALREEVSEIKAQLELLRQAQGTGEPRTPLEDDVHAMRKNLDEFLQFLSTAIRNQ